MKYLLAKEIPLVHLDPGVIAQYVDARPIDENSQRHLAACELCRTRASDGRLLRALIARRRDNMPRTSIPLDAATLAGYNDQSLPADQMSAVDRRLLADDNALLELIELRIGLHSGLRAGSVQAQLVAKTAATFSNTQPQHSGRIASLGTLLIDWDSELPAFHFHPATPETVVSIGNTPSNPSVNDSGSYPAPVARRELSLHAGRHTLRVRFAAGNRLELFVFDEQNFRPANGIQVSFEPETGTSARMATRHSGIVGFELKSGPARLLIDAGDRWVLELR